MKAGLSHQTISQALNISLHSQYIHTWEKYDTTANLPSYGYPAKLTEMIISKESCDYNCNERWIFTLCFVVFYWCFKYNIFTHTFLNDSSRANTAGKQFSLCHWQTPQRRVFALQLARCCFHQMLLDTYQLQLFTNSYFSTFLVLVQKYPKDFFCFMFSWLHLWCHKGFAWLGWHAKIGFQHHNFRWILLHLFPLSFCGQVNDWVKYEFFFNI